MASAIRRRRFLHLAAGSALAAPAAVRCKAAAKKPGDVNVLFLMTDEQHHASTSIAGSSYIQTPHMDRIAREGVRFTRATCVTPYCSPSRASLITGVYPHTHGILVNVNPNRGQQKPLPPGAFANTETTLARCGYVTRHRGKWHLGDKGDFGCYESLGYAGRNYHQFLKEKLPASKFAADKDPGRYLGRPVRKTPAVRKGYAKFKAIPNNRLHYIGIIGRSVIPPKLLPETQITNQVIQQIRQNKDKTFMITASWSPPHDLWVIPEPYYSMVDRKKLTLHGAKTMPAWDQRGPSKRLGDIMGDAGLREYAAIYHGMVKYIDDEVGRVLKTLDELGLAENTLVIFTSDHGDMAGAHGCIGKSVSGFYDDLVRIPLMLRLPGRIRPDTTVDAFVSQIDLMPTIMDYLGRPIPPGIHGRSMRPLIEGKKVAWRDYAFSQRANHSRMLRTARWKYVFALRPKGMLVLHDLQADPHEDKNLAGDPTYADRLRTMHNRLLAIMKTDRDPLLKQMPMDPLA